jgi:NAD(P)H-hydrate epimerase
VQVLNAAQVKAWDQFTIQHEPVLSIDLMERAAGLCAEWIMMQGWNKRTFHIFCGSGNNGGDGLVIARLLTLSGYTVITYIVDKGRTGTHDQVQNLARLNELKGAVINFIDHADHFPSLPPDAIVIDALFGTGINLPPSGLYASLIVHLNQSALQIISIDLPSGMFPDGSSIHSTIIRANHTLTFQCYKPALLLPENGPYIGQLHVIDIGLHPGFLESLQPAYTLIEEPLVKSIYRKRNRFAHKGNFGHALLIGGSLGKIGAMVLATGACLRSGAGLTTAYLPRCGYQVIQASNPEAMVLHSESEEHLSSLPDDIEKYASIGIGPGAGTKDETAKMISFIIRRYTRPLVIDADGLNCLSLQPELLPQLPPSSILTPHPKEFERLFGSSENDEARLRTAIDKAKEYRIIIVLKGHHTVVATPEGRCYFNTTGNPGMAKGGSGDVLTGMITAFLAQGYPPEHAAVFCVYLHGKAGDMAATKFSQEAMLPGDLINLLPQAFLSLR